MKLERNDKAQPMVFDAASLGTSLRKLAVDVVRGEDTDLMSRWFRSSLGNADLVIWTDGEKRIVKYQLCFYGQVVDWNPIKGTRTGFILEEEFGPESDCKADLEPGADCAETIRFDRSVQAPVVEQAIDVLRFVPELDETDRSNLIFNLRKSPRLHKNARERALKTWAPKADELTSTVTSTRRPTFWNRLAHWVFGE